MAFEEPKYTILSKLEHIEIRQYQEYLVAQAEVEGSRDQAGSNGFKILAAYIFGNNKEKDNISMTAPVVQTETKGDRKWVIQFMMPSKFAMSTLPSPKDQRVHFKQIPARKIAAITYSGRWSETNYNENLEILNREIKKANLKPKGVPLWARYNSPFTPWFLRKNEILIELE